MTILYTKLICDCNTCVLLYTENKIMLLTISIVINRSQLDNSEKCRLYNVIIIRTFNLKLKKKNIYQRERSQLKIIGSSSHKDDCTENIIKLLQSVWIDERHSHLPFHCI